MNYCEDILPKSCCLKGLRRALLISLLPHALGDKLSQEQIHLAHLEQQPFLGTMKQVLCRNCPIFDCLLNDKFIPPDLGRFATLFNGNFEHRRRKAETILKDLFTAETRASLRNAEIESFTLNMPSRKNPLLYIHLEKWGVSVSITCQVGKRLMDVNGRNKPLTFRQVAQEIKKAIQVLD